MPTRLLGLAALAVLAIGATAPRHVRAQAHEPLSDCAYPQSAQNKSLEVIVDADRISLRARDVPLCAVLVAFAAETGLTVYGDVTDNRRIDALFEHQRLSYVLERLLGEGGYLLVLGDDARGRMRALAPSTEQRATATSPDLAGEAVVVDRRARLEAIESAAESDDTDAVSMLALALADTDTEMREVAVATLAMLDTPNAHELLYAAMQDTDADVRLEVVDTLGDLDDARSTAALEHALADTDPRVREAAAEYLAERE